MTAANWIALLSAVAAICGLAIQGGLFAFHFGKMSARLQALEARPVDTDCKAELAAMNATLAALKENILSRMDTTERTIRELLLRREGV